MSERAKWDRQLRTKFDLWRRLNRSNQWDEAGKTRSLLFGDTKRAVAKCCKAYNKIELPSWYCRHVMPQGERTSFGSCFRRAEPSRDVRISILTCPNTHGPCFPRRCPIRITLTTRQDSGIEVLVSNFSALNFFSSLRH